MQDQRVVDDQQRRAWSAVASVGLHGLVLLLGAWLPEPAPEPRRLEVTLVTPDPAPPSRAAPPREGEPPEPVAPEASARAPAPPRSFREWQRARASKYRPVGNPFGEAQGQAGTEGDELVARNRCEPIVGRRFDRLYLLMDSSGSMDSARRAEALACAHQYAQAAIRVGASVVVGNFARDAQFYGPTTSMLDVEVAIRSSVDASATILPWGQLEPFLAREPDQTAELVIVSDGMFGTGPELLDWYRSFLDRNAANRATMYTVGARGERQSVHNLKGSGVDVFLYDQVRRD